MPDFFSGSVEIPYLLTEEAAPGFTANITQVLELAKKIAAHPLGAMPDGVALGLEEAAKNFALLMAVNHGKAGTQVLGAYVNINQAGIFVQNPASTLPDHAWSGNVDWTILLQPAYFLDYLDGAIGSAKTNELFNRLSINPPAVIVAAVPGD